MDNYFELVYLYPWGQQNKVLMPTMGLIVMVIAVEFIFSGLKPSIRDILNI